MNSPREPAPNAVLIHKRTNLRLLLALLAVRLVEETTLYQKKNGGSATLPQKVIHFTDVLQGYHMIRSLVIVIGIPVRLWKPDMAIQLS